MTKLSFNEKYNLRINRFAVQSIIFYVNHSKNQKNLEFSVNSSYVHPLL